MKHINGNSTGDAGSIRHGLMSSQQAREWQLVLALANSNVLSERGGVKAFSGCTGESIAFHISPDSNRKNTEIIIGVCMGVFSVPMVEYVTF